MKRWNSNSHAFVLRIGTTCNLSVIMGGTSDYQQPKIQWPDQELDQQGISHMKELRKIEGSSYSMGVYSKQTDESIKLYSLNFSFPSRILWLTMCFSLRFDKLKIHQLGYEQRYYQLCFSIRLSRNLIK